MVLIHIADIPEDVLVLIGWYFVLGFGSIIMWVNKRRGGS